MPATYLSKLYETFEEGMTFIFDTLEAAGWVLVYDFSGTNRPSNMPSSYNDAKLYKSLGYNSRFPALYLLIYRDNSNNVIFLGYRYFVEGLTDLNAAWASGQGVFGGPVKLGEDSLLVPGEFLYAVADEEFFFMLPYEDRITTTAPMNVRAVMAIDFHYQIHERLIPTANPHIFTVSDTKHFIEGHIYNVLDDNGLVIEYYQIQNIFADSTDSEAWPGTVQINPTITPNPIVPSNSDRYISLGTYPWILSCYGGNSSIYHAKGYGSMVESHQTTSPLDNTYRISSGTGGGAANYSPTDYILGSKLLLPQLNVEYEALYFTSNPNVSNVLKKFGWCGVISTPLLVGALTANTITRLIIGTGPGQGVNTRRGVGDATATTLIDLNANWTENEHIGKSVVIVSGYGINQKRKIISNTQTSLFLKTPWRLIPNQTSIYQFCYDGYRRIGGTATNNFFLKEEF
jgi:hypothetical protein